MKNTSSISRSPSQSPPPTRDQIATLAFRLYQENGCQPGRELDDWIRAERQLATEAAAQDGAVTILETRSPNRVVDSRDQPKPGASPRDEIRQHGPHPAARQTRRAEPAQMQP